MMTDACAHTTEAGVRESGGLALNSNSDLVYIMSFCQLTTEQQPVTISK